MEEMEDGETEPQVFSITFSSKIRVLFWFFRSSSPERADVMPIVIDVWKFDIWLR